VNRFTLGELTLLQLAVLETAAAIGEWEFQTRVGLPRSRALGLALRLETYAQDLRWIGDQESGAERKITLEECDGLLLWSALNEAQNGIGSKWFARSAQQSDVNINELRDKLRRL
jgi:hypothetical protein